MEDETIIEQLRLGSNEAFKVMYNKYYAQLFVYTHSFLQNTEDAKDLLQTCFLQLYNRPKNWARVNDLRGYLYSTVRKQSLYYLRSLKSTSIKIDSYIYHYLTAMEFQTPEALTTIEQRESGLRVSDLLSSLSPKRSKIFELVYLDRKSYKQVAELLGVSRETIKTHLSLARSILREKLALFIILSSLSVIVLYLH